ncbi:hypothetical protein UU9_12303 [Rhodanobacter fulvus Jip2]|uniref:Bacteriophage protein n=1 Tax=Rhodanobacter fulvus Jip2 TaxID=1163408 RepID=I4VMT9_9GAMM|nr:DUF3383 domain-containing protein [Rhodanobacter fulvus]EIL88530.1 hypothetical protein UU9_12303 [Rhodanobacter fulvus Jip2]
MTLSVSSVVNVTVSLSPTAAAERNFGSILILGSSGIVTTAERLRAYTNLDDIAVDFGTTAPEYKAAALFFAQSPQPSLAYLGEWAQSATSASIRGGVLTLADQAIGPFQAITSGTLSLSINGTVKNLTALDFSDDDNLNAVAGTLTTALTSAGTVTWNAAAARFEIVSATTGITSTITAAADGAVASLLKMQASQAEAPVAGVAAETLVDAVADLADKSSDWYGLVVAAAGVDDDDVLAVAAFIEGVGTSRVYGVTSQDAQELVTGQTTSLGYRLAQLKYQRTFWQYSSSNPYAAASAFGRAFTVNFDGSNTTITLKFKQEPGVVAEDISASQAAAINANHGNVFVKYNNATAILQQGVVANGYYFDEVHGLAWLQNAVQTAVYNLLYTNPKIPQTDAGVNQLVTTINRTLDQSVTNGLVAPGVWNAAGFGSLSQGDTLSTGFYVYAPKIATQSQADREARKAPPIQIALKLAGAVHSADVLINVNR